MGPLVRYRVSGVVLVLAVLCVFGARDVQAQEFGRPARITATGVPYYVFIEAGEPSIQVMVVGVGGSGLYEIGAETTLSEFLILSGAAPPAGQSRTTIRLLREQGGERRAVYEASLEEFLAEPAAHPKLAEGDVLVVEAQERERFGWREAVSVISGLSSLVILALNIARVAG